MDATGSSVAVPLRWTDLDAQGHVYYGAYVTLFDQGRTKWLRETIALPGFAAHAVVHVEIDYVSEVDGTIEEVLVDCGVRRLGTTSFTIAETMRKPDGQVAAHASTTIVCFDLQTRRAVTLTGAQRSVLARHLAE